jgi:type VI secretion system protein ImpJ
MTAKQQGLAASRRQRTATMVEFQAADAAKFWLLHSLNGALPNIAEIAEQPSTHPQEAHRVLSSFVGQLCTFDAQASPLSLPRFNYLELGDVFEPLFAKAMSLLDAVIAERFVTIPLVEREGQFFYGEIRDPNVLRHDFFLSVEGVGPVTEAQVREYMPKMAKIASHPHIQSIVRSAVSGAPLMPEYRPPGALPVKPGVVFFRIDRSNEYWTHVLATGTIAVASPFAPGTVQVGLYAVDPSTLQ